MIGYLTGEVINVHEGVCLLNVSGVGYEVWVHTATEAEIFSQKHVSLYTHHVVREDMQSLYGFKTMRERDLFRIFLMAPGVGPKLALLMLSSLPEHVLLSAIENKDTAMLKKVKGVGQRLAEKMALDLAPRLKDWHGCYSSEDKEKNSVQRGVVHDVISALESLGYSSSQVIDKVDALYLPDMTTDQLLRKALQALM